MTNRRSFLKSVATALAAAALVCRLKGEELVQAPVKNEEPKQELSQEYLDAAYEEVFFIHPRCTNTALAGLNAPVPRYDLVNGQFIRR